MAEALARSVDFVVLAGDLYDGAERGIRAQRAFLDGVTQLADAGIRTLLVHGNHDPVAEGWTAITEFPDLVTTFPAHRVASVRFEAGGEQVTVHGTSYAVAATSENLARRYPVAEGGGFHLGLLHANVGGPSTGHADYSPCTVDDLRRTGYHYWALGHVHGRRTLHQGDPWVVYPGNLQGRSTKPTERGPKGAVVVTVTDGVAAEPTFVPLDRVRFVDLTLSITPTATSAACSTSSRPWPTRAPTTDARSSCGPPSRARAPCTSSSPLPGAGPRSSMTSAAAAPSGPRSSGGTT